MHQLHPGYMYHFGGTNGVSYLQTTTTLETNQAINKENAYSSQFTTPSFPVYRAYLKILVFSFYKAQFGCSPS